MVVASKPFLCRGQTDELLLWVEPTGIAHILLVKEMATLYEEELAAISEGGGFAVSLSGLSVWDFGQDCYLDVYAIAELHAPYAALHEAKFGAAPQFPAEAPGGGVVLELGNV